MIIEASRAAHRYARHQHDWEKHVRREREKRGVPLPERIHPVPSMRGATPGLTLTELAALIPIEREKIGKWAYRGKIKTSRGWRKGWMKLVAPAEVARLIAEYGTREEIQF